MFLRRNTMPYRTKRRILPWEYWDNADHQKRWPCYSSRRTHQDGGCRMLAVSRCVSGFGWRAIFGTTWKWRISTGCGLWFSTGGTATMWWWICALWRRLLLGLSPWHGVISVVRLTEKKSGSSGRGTTPLWSAKPSSLLVPWCHSRASWEYFRWAGNGHWLCVCTVL